MGVSQTGNAKDTTSIGLGTGALETSATTRGPALTGKLSYQWSVHSALSLHGSYDIFWRDKTAGPIEFLHLTHRLTIDVAIGFENTRLFGYLGVGLSPFLTQVKLSSHDASVSQQLVKGVGGHLSGCAGIQLTPHYSLGILLEGFNRGPLIDGNAQVIFRAAWNSKESPTRE
jgi:hypothetical protein